MAVSLAIRDKTYPGQGKCLICLRKFTEDSEDQLRATVEHIIPEALCKIGQMRIYDGTCLSCNNSANDRFENKALHADFNTARILFELKRKKRSKKNRTQLSLPPVHIGNGLNYNRKFDYELTKDEYPNIIQLMVFEPAGKLIGLQKGGHLQSFRIATFFIGSKPNQIKDVTIREVRNHTAFALTIAKIAYCFAAAELGIDTFDGDQIRDLLRGVRNDTYNFVGGILKEECLTNRFLHSLYIRQREDFITVIVHLFASCGMTPYEVFIGTMRN